MKIFIHYDFLFKAEECSFCKGATLMALNYCSSCGVSQNISPTEQSVREASEEERKQASEEERKQASEEERKQAFEEERKQASEEERK